MPLSLSASDWTRLQRRRSAFIAEKTTPVHKQTPASKWINAVGSTTEDYVLKSESSSKLPVLTRVQLCKCTQSSVLYPKVGICSKCTAAQHLRLN